MTVRKPFQSLLTALAIASGAAVYGATGQQNLLHSVDDVSQNREAARQAILASESADSTAVQLLAQKGSRDSGGGRSGGGSSSSGSSGRSSGGSSSSAGRSSGGSSGGSSSGRSSGGSSGGSSSGRSSGGSASSAASSRVQAPRSSDGGGSRASSTPRVEAPRSSNSAPRANTAPRVETPRNATPRVESSNRSAQPKVNTPRVDPTPRANTPRVDSTPRVNTPRVESTPRNNPPRVDSTPRNNPPRVDSNTVQGIPRSNDRGNANNPPKVNIPKVDPPKVAAPRPDRDTRVESRGNASGNAATPGGNKLDGSVRNNNSADVNRRGDAEVRSGTRGDVESRIPRANTLPKIGDNKPGNDSRNNADRTRDLSKDAVDRTRDAAKLPADRIRENANRGDTKPGDVANDRVRDRLDNKPGDTRPGDTKPGDVARDADRARDRLGITPGDLKPGDRDNKPGSIADRVRDRDNTPGNRDNLDPKLRDQLDRAKDNRDPNDRTRDRDASDLVRDNKGPVGDRDPKASVRDRIGGTKPVVVRPDRINDPEFRDRLDREKIVIRDNDRTINLTPINRPGVGSRFGRDNIGDRRVALNGLLHQSHNNRNVRYNGRYNDWHSWQGNNFSRHNNWHRGYWNFNRWNGGYGRNWWGFGIGFGGGWGGGWGGNGGWGGGWGGWGGGWGYPTAMSFGLSPWGMNYMGYGFGLYDYYNPYCYQPVPFYGGYSYDYTQPLIVNNYSVDPGVQSVAQNVVPDQQPQQAEPDMQLFEQARSAFASGNYEQSLQLTEQQIQKTPKDSILHEFRSLVLFALGRFEDAAIPAYAVLAVGPGWDWATMSSLYGNVNSYAAQLKALEDFHRSNPDVAYASFLLGYHYLTCGHNEAAAAQLDNVLRINPQDLVATRLLQAIGDGSTAPADQDPTGADQPTIETALVVPDIPELPAEEMVTADELYGTWTSQSSKGKTFTLTMTQDGTFQWQSKDDKKSVEQKGVFGVEGETLAMEPDGGGVLMGKISKPVNGTFQLALVGGLPDDAALEFKKVQ